MIACSVFCEVLHSEAIRRKCDVTHQDEAFVYKVFRRFWQIKKVKQKSVPYTHKDVMFLEDISLPLTDKKVMQEPLPYLPYTPYTGKSVSEPSCLHGKMTGHGYL